MLIFSSLTRATFFIQKQAPTFLYHRWAFLPPPPPTQRAYVHKQTENSTSFGLVKNPFSFMPTFEIACARDHPPLTSAEKPTRCVARQRINLCIFIQKQCVPLNRAPIIIHLSTPGQKENYFIHFSGDGSVFFPPSPPHPSSISSRHPFYKISTPPPQLNTARRHIANIYIQTIAPTCPHVS